MLQCPRCHRANPEHAVFCWFEGAELRPVGGAAVPRNRLLQEFTFPSGRRCNTFDELVQGCQYEWDDARQMLKEGTFTSYLAGIGRLDLARFAQDAQGQPNADIALHNFVSRLPATQVQGPRLDPQPRRLVVGSLRSGDSVRVTLAVGNLGTGLLRGTLSLPEEDDWIRLADVRGRELPLSTGRTQEVALEVDAKGLPPQVYTSKLTLISNGGVAEVPVRLDVLAVPFPRAPFQGAGSPRALAEKMRTQPKAAVALLESGEVSRWFATNGWAYPVIGAPARGVAAVQQFFEGMGLAKPPQVYLSEYEAHFSCSSKQLVSAEVVLATQGKKWVYAGVESDTHWLIVTTPLVSGPQQAAIAYDVDASLVRPGQVHFGTITVTANAGQQMVLRVSVEVRRPNEPFTRRLLRPFFHGALIGLLYRLLLAGPSDLYARLWCDASQTGGFATWLQAPPAETAYLRAFVTAVWWVGPVLILYLLWKRGLAWLDVPCGLLAGAVAGVAGAATLGCLVEVVDTFPRMLWQLLSRPVQHGSLAEIKWLWTPLWILAATLSWTLLGAGAGFLLGLTGPAGRRVLEVLTAPLRWVGLHAEEDAAVSVAR